MIDEFSGIDQIIEPAAMEEVGFAVGVVRGVRAFNVDKMGRLRGITYNQIWVPGENRAGCRQDADLMWALSYQISRTIGGRSTATAPTPAFREVAHAMRDCKHGFYAYYDGSNDYRDEERINAVIEGYGETVIGSRGFRCMKARIVALHIPKTVKPHLAQMVARNYPEIPIMDSFDRMVSEFPPDAAGNEITPENDPEFWTRPA
jgi:hypothetical protein